MKRVISLILILLVIAGVYYGFYLADISCPIKFLTGLSCAGCGMTRACINLLFGDFEAAFHFHPLSFLMPLFAVIFIVLFAFNNKRAMYQFLIGFSAIMLVVWIVRFFTTPDIVSFTPSESILFKLFQ